MKISQFLSFLILCTAAIPSLSQKRIIIANSGFTFTPDDIVAEVGDTIEFKLGNTHNAVEVARDTWNSNGLTSNGGFSVSFGGGLIILGNPGSLYYVCQPHISFGMKGKIQVLTKSDSEEFFFAFCSGNQQSPPVRTQGSGSLLFRLSNDSLFVSGEVRKLSSNIDTSIAGGIHIHSGIAGQTGPIVFPLILSQYQNLKIALLEETQNAFVLSPEQISLLRSKQLYVNLHTESNKTGEVRGQVLSDAETYLSTHLYGSYHSPEVLSSGVGYVIGEIDGEKITFSGSFSNLNSKALNTSGDPVTLNFALAGSKGNTFLPLIVDWDNNEKGGLILPENNTISITSLEKQNFNNQAVYINIKSESEPNGELRGQLTGFATMKFNASLSGMQETESNVLSFGSGALVGQLFENTLAISGSFRNLSGDLLSLNSTGAHIHLGKPGSQGAIKIPLEVSQDGGMRSGSFELNKNIFNLDPQLVNDLINRNLYINIHTSKHPSGELRGQILPESQAFFYSNLNGSQLNQSKYLPGTGALIGEFSGNSLVLSGTFTDLEGELSSSTSTLHIGSAGKTNQGFANLNIDRSNSFGQIIGSENSIELSQIEIDHLFNRSLNVQINSSKNTSGEMRGQLLPNASIYMMAIPSGSLFPNPINTKSHGTFIAEFNENKINLSGSVDNNSNQIFSLGFHSGISGLDGIPLTDLEIPLNLQNILIEDISIINLPQLSNRELYIKIQTDPNLQKYIRGQFHPLANGYFTSFAEGSNVVPLNNSQGKAHIEVEIWKNQLTISGSIKNFNFNENSEVNLRYGITGKNGNIAKPIVITPVPNTDDFFIDPAENSFTFLPSQLSILSNNGIYLEINDGLNPANSIRGQILYAPNFYPQSTTQSSYNSGDTICVNKNQDSLISINWNEAIDLEGNPTNYLFEMSPNRDLSNPYFNFETSSERKFEISFNSLDSILESVGVQKGSHMNLFLRVSVTDGSLVNKGLIDSVILKNGIETSISNSYSNIFDAKLFPSPIGDNGTLTISSKNQMELNVKIIDYNGKVHSENKLSLYPGLRNIPINLNMLPAGMYLLSFAEKNKWVGTVPFIKVN